MQRAIALAVLVVCSPALVGAGPWDGTYRLSAGADCTAVGAEGGALRIADGQFTGAGLVCDMTLPVDVLDMDATLYTMACTSAGETWSERAMVMKDAEGGGILMIWNGYAFRYGRCPG